MTNHLPLSVLNRNFSAERKGMESVCYEVEVQLDYLGLHLVEVDPYTGLVTWWIPSEEWYRIGDQLKRETT